MKTRIPGPRRRETAFRIGILPLMWVIIFAIEYWYDPGRGLRAYISDLAIPVAIMTALYSIVVVYILKETCSFELDESGIWCYPKLGRARYTRWEEFAYVGLMLQKRPKYNRLVLVCSQTMPRVKHSWHDAYTCDKKAFVIPYSQEACAAVKACCPSFSVRFEKFFDRRHMP